MRFTVATPDFTHASAGVWLLHRLAHLLSLAGHEVLATASVLGPWNTYRTRRRDEDPGIPILPEIYDFSEATKVPRVRWVLNVPGKLGGPTKYAAEEMVWHLNPDLETPAKSASADGESRLLRLPTLDMKDFAPMPKDIASIWYQGKFNGPLPPIPDPLALRITATWPVTREETLQLLRRSKVFYCLDTYTQIIQEAALAGALVKLWVREQWRKYVPVPSQVDPLIINDVDDLEMVKGFAERVADWMREKGRTPHPNTQQLPPSVAYEQRQQLSSALVSMVILTFNQLDYTKKCVESIRRCTPERHEIIFVDNASTDGTVEWLRALVVANPHYRLIENRENLGFAKGCNQGMAAAAGDYVLLLNNDVVVTPGWLGRMLACTERKPQIGIVGPMSNHVSGPQLAKDLSYDTNSLAGLHQFAEHHARQHQGQGEPFWRVVGFCMLIKKAVVDKIGGLDYRYGLGNFEDDDFSLRSALAGFESWIARDAFVHHFANRTFLGAGIDYNESLRKNWEIFKKKWGIPMDVPYGAPYDRMEGVNHGFVLAEHYFPLTWEESSKEVANQERKPVPESGAVHGGEKPMVKASPANGYSKVADFLNRQGELQFEKGHPERARVCFEMALEHHPDHPKVHNNLGVLFWQQGELDKALKSLHRALALAPQDAEILYNSSKALSTAGELNSAADLLKFYLRENPHDKVAWEDHASLVRQAGGLTWKPDGLPAEAADLYTLMGKELLDANDYFGAGEALHRALLVNAQQVEAFFQLGRLHLALGQPVEAVGLLQEALSLDPHHEPSELALTQANAFQEIPDVATIVGKAVESHP